MFHGFWFNKRDKQYSTFKFPHCYVGVKNILGNDFPGWYYLANIGEKLGFFRFNNIGENIGYGTFGGSQVQHVVTPSSCTNLDNYLMIENSWHKISGHYDQSVTLALLDANDILMQNPDYVIDIYYKIIVPRVDNFSAGQAVLRYDHRMTVNHLLNLGFTSTCRLLNAGNNPPSVAAVIEPGSSSPFALPSLNTLTNGHTSVVFNEGRYIDNFNNSNDHWSEDLWKIQQNADSQGTFLSLGAPANAHAMLVDCNFDNNNSFAYVVDPSVGSIGIPCTPASGINYYLPKLFCGLAMVGTQYNKYMDGILYICLGVHNKND